MDEGKFLFRCVYASLKSLCPSVGMSFRPSITGLFFSVAIITENGQNMTGNI